jgi:hypothetical protein
MSSSKSRVFFFKKIKDFYSESMVRSSSALLFPSLYEGYGSPPIESAMINVNSILSNRPSMREITCGKLMLLSPNSIFEWSLALQNLRKFNKFFQKNRRAIFRAFVFYIN